MRSANRDDIISTSWTNGRVHAEFAIVSSGGNECVTIVCDAIGRNGQRLIGPRTTAHTHIDDVTTVISCLQDALEDDRIDLGVAWFLDGVIAREDTVRAKIGIGCGTHVSCVITSHEA